jgi:hypothetical protein
MTQSPAVTTAADDNTAWVSVEIPAPPADAVDFCRDVGRLLRLNPYLEIRAWEEVPGPFGPGKRYRLQALNEMTGIEHDLTLTVATANTDGFTIGFSEGAKCTLALHVSPHGTGTALTLREHYDREADPAVLAQEVDRSLMPWAVAIRRHYIGMGRWGWLPGYRPARRFWLRMKPRERRIGRLLIWISALEFVLFLVVLALFVSAKS